MLTDPFLAALRTAAKGVTAASQQMGGPMTNGDSTRHGKYVEAADAILARKGTNNATTALPLFLVWQACSYSLPMPAADLPQWAYDK